MLLRRLHFHFRENFTHGRHRFCNAQVSVVLALALPFLSLSFGYTPAKHDLDTAAEMVQATVEELSGWEISSLLWAAARLGYRPADHVTKALLQQVLSIVPAQTPASPFFARMHQLGCIPWDPTRLCLVVR